MSKTVTATIRFRPLAPETLMLLLIANQAANEDPVDAYGLLLSAALVAGAMLGLTHEHIHDQVKLMYDNAIRAVAERRDVFNHGSPEKVVLQ